ncbi:MAG: hypothetical protein QW343_03405, partial [Candidatus Norongarragalinales archaeon]
DVGGVDSIKARFYDENADTAFNGKIWYSTSGGAAKAYSSAFTSPRGSVGIQQATVAQVKYALSFTPAAAIATPVATSAPMETPTAIPSPSSCPPRTISCWCPDHSQCPEYQDAYGCWHWNPANCPQYPTPTATPTPTPIPGSCNELTNVVASKDEGLSVCGFTVTPRRFYENRAGSGWWTMVDYEVNGRLLQTVREYQSTIMTSEGGRALFIKFGSDFTATTAEIAQIVPFEKYFLHLRQGEIVSLANGTRITLESASAAAEGCGTAVFSATPLASTATPQRQSITTGQNAVLSGRVRAFVFTVHLDGSVTVGFTPSLSELPPLTSDVVSSEPAGFQVFSCFNGVPRGNAGITYRFVRRCGTFRPVGDQQILVDYRSEGSMEKTHCFVDGSFDMFYHDSSSLQKPVGYTPATQPVNVIDVAWKTISRAVGISPAVSEEAPPTPPSERASTAKIELAAGWNLVSAPLEQARVSATDCAARLLWHWNPATRAYESPVKLAVGTRLEAMKGYWVFADNACSFSVEGSGAASVEGKPLFAGWNQIGGPMHPVSFNAVSTACVVTSGPWEYNSAAQKYVKAGALQPGKSYFVKVAGDCQLYETNAGSEDLAPPALPSDNAAQVQSEERVRSNVENKGVSSRIATQVRTREDAAIIKESSESDANDYEKADYDKAQKGSKGGSKSVAATRTTTAS